MFLYKYITELCLEILLCFLCAYFIKYNIFTNNEKYTLITLFKYILRYFVRVCVRTHIL